MQYKKDRVSVGTRATNLLLEAKVIRRSILKRIREGMEEREMNNSVLLLRNFFVI
jgi:hypothetical protein